MICLATPRLLLRTWRGDDLDSLVQHFAEVDESASTVIETGNLVIDPDPARPDADDITALRHWFERVDRTWDQHGYGLFVLERLDDGAVIGLAGLETTADPRRPRLLWRIRAVRGPGVGTGIDLSTEAVTAVIDWGFGLHELDAVFAAIDAHDLESTDVARAAGLRLSPDGMQLRSGLPFRHLSLTHEQWSNSV